MTDINPTPSWAAVRQLETNEYAKGGPNGNMNEQAKALAARSEFLKQHNNLEGRSGSEAHPSESIQDGNQTQKEINLYGGKKYDMPVGGYPVGAVVLLNNGDEVKSTIANNIANPNIDMTGWVQKPNKTTSANVLDASGKTQQELNTWNYEVVDFDIYNTPERYGASASKLDNTVELQAWLDSSPLLHLRPFKTYKFSGKLSLTVQDQSIIGLTHQKYGQSILLFEGVGTAVDTPSNLGYLYFSGWQLKSKINTVGAVFDVGTKGFELKNGSVIEANRWFCSNFETLVESDGNSFYNKFNLCRFSDTRDVLKDFAAYNLEITSCRFNRFTNVLSTRTSGDVKMQFNSFERFNGYFHTSVGGTVCNLSFLSNYVETFSNELMPVNFLPATQSQTKGDYWGGNTLFTGNYFSWSCEGNQLTIDGVFRILSAFSCDSIRSISNGIAICSSGNNLERMFFVTSGTIKSVHINDIKSGGLSRDGGYTRTYLNFNPSQISKVRNRYYYYDCISDVYINLPAKQSTATLLNGWSGQTGGFNVATATKILANDDGSTSISGVITGTSKTDSIILNIPLSIRPEQIGTTQIRAMFYSYALSNNPTVNDLCVLSYEYSSGNLSLVKNLGSLVDIPLNLSIPVRL